MLKLIAFLCLLAYTLASTTPNGPFGLNARITVDGTKSTTIDQYPFVISVQYSGSRICGGSIISAEWVMTSATCMVYSLSGYTVRVGTSTPNSGGTVYGVASATRHPDYSSRTYDYDIALIRISGSITFDTNVQPVDLGPIEPSGGDLSRVIGYGLASTTSSRMEYMEFPIVPREQCMSSYEDLITDRMICAGYIAGGRDACYSKVGDPLIVNGVQIGMMSWSYGCNRPNYPGVYSNVVNLRSWINQVSGV